MTQRSERYRKTQRPTLAGDVDTSNTPESEELAEKRGRYGGFATYMTVFLALAAIAALVGSIIFWPD